MKLGGGGPYRSGPWPGLTLRGAAVLLLCAAALGLLLRLIGEPTRAWPDLAILTVAACVPLALATRMVGMPGVASAVCGAYLLPRALISLVDPSVDPPPLLLAPAFAFDGVAWIRRSDFSGLRNAWPFRRRTRWPARRDRSPRRLRPARGALAGAVFAVVLVVVQPPFSILLGSDPAAWSTLDTLLAGAVSAAACAAIGALAAVHHPRA